VKTILALCLILAGVPARACGLELVLATDVSRSVVNAEYELQMGGLATAFRTPEVIHAIAGIQGGVAATVTQWSGPTSQTQAVDWHLLSDPPSIARFAAAIAATRRQFFAAYTAVGEALVHADWLSRTAGHDCRRRVIDISGDGASNRGRDPAPLAAALAARGVTVNALVIAGARPDPAEFYARHVVAGPGAFLEIADSFQDYAAAMTRKLVRELSPMVAHR